MINHVVFNLSGQCRLRIIIVNNEGISWNIIVFSKTEKAPHIFVDGSKENSPER